MLPFLWLPLWWFCISDHPRQAKWISAQERDFLETTLQREAAELEPPQAVSSWTRFRDRTVWVLIAMYFLQNGAAYGCMTFFTSSLKGRDFTGLQYGILFGIPYALTAVVMVLNSRHSDKTGERRGHVALVYFLSGISLILSVGLREHFWVSYVLMCVAIPGPFAAMGPFWSIPSETLPRSAAGLVIGLVNAFGNLGGFAGPYIAGWLKQEYQSLTVAFDALGAGLLIGAALAFLLPKAAHQLSPAPTRKAV
jgi:nitrate/nitrite transporter NarK